MEKDMLGDVVRKLVALSSAMLVVIYDLLEKLLGGNGEQWFAALKRFLRKENPWPKLLKRLTTFKVPGAEQFVVADHFRVGNDKGVKIAWIGANFNSCFGKKIEKVVQAAELTVQGLGEASLDAPILAELGERAETSLAHLWALLLQQPKGEAGTLLTNGFANIFYVRDDEGTLWTVSAHWSGGGWDVSADSVERPNEWDAGRQVISR